MNKRDEELLDQAQQLRAEAQGLLYQDGLLAAIQRFGPTFVSGSVVLDLIVRRDVDVYVRLSDGLDITTFFAIGTIITQQFQVLKASYSNHFIRNFAGFDHGLYWGIALKHRGQKWKLDLWGYGSDRFADHCAQLEQLRDGLKTVDRLTILRLKDGLREGDGYGHGESAYHIYEAVLTANVSTVEQFCDWWGHKGPQ